MNKILSYEDIFTLNSQNFEALFLKYCEFLKQNIAEQKPNLELSYRFKIDSLTPKNRIQMILFIEDKMILQTLFKFPQNISPNRRKLNKLKNYPGLFFKDMLKNILKKLLKKLD